MLMGIVESKALWSTCCATSTRLHRHCEESYDQEAELPGTRWETGQPIMICNENEYEKAVGLLADLRKRMTEHRTRLKGAGLSEVEIKRVIDPIESFHLQLQDEVESYQRQKR